MPADQDLTPRSRRVREAVLRAATELLAEGGLPAATVDAVSARSGVSKATIYKHWSNRICVAIDAFALHMAEATPVPDTGSAREDLTLQVHNVAAFYGGPVGRVYAQLLAATVTDPEAAELLRRRFLEGRRELIRQMWRRGVERGELRTDIDVEVAQDVLFGAIIFRLVSGHAPLTPAEAEAMAEAALTGLLARPAGEPEGPARR
ncbi:TetR/AcrR family transcriptional regulator [Bailinhaonella thermotolerans]|uniref:TetR/AcrR family transcriptional regulator n=1 Tax=Bailinhaonella thermotolerans TaxID=1070861 RepID=A0A3A4B9U7_9ACTN|nr:TetR/AcrR family transcriptional regulator [Bailinhaonella thermotolerans]RJL35333.1 TetR/AcrR family transcriptional regulator [Bailinhaonella thermotolerans]